MHGIKGIGFTLHDGSIYDDMEYELMAVDEIRDDMFDLVPYYKENPLVQKAVADVKAYLNAKKEKEAEISTISEGVEPEMTEQSKPEKEKEIPEKAGSKKESVLKALRERQAKSPPKRFAGHRISVSDVIAHNKDGVTSAYYIDKDGFITIAGFFRSNSSSTLITMETRDYPIEGYQGSWAATDEIIIDGKQFFMMENEQYGRNAAPVVIDADGKFVTDDCSEGFDEKVILQIREYLHPPKELQQHLQEKPQMETYQKYFENGEYLRSAEMDEEQNYNMIDGRINNRKKKPKVTDPKKRKSVLKLLHQKQNELEKRYGKKSQEVEMERNRK